MTTKIQRLSRIIPYTILGITLYTVLPYPKPSVKVIDLINVTFFWWIVQFYILFLFWQGRKYFFNKNQKRIMVWVHFYLLWNVFSLSRGLFIAETYWDWKALVANVMALMLPIVAYSATNTTLLQAVIQKYIKYALPLFLVFFVLIASDAYGFYLVPISFLVLFFPIIKKPWRWIVLGVGLFVIIADVTARSNVIKFGVPIVLSLLYYFRHVLSSKIFEIVRLMLIVAPILFFTLAVYGDFNVLKMDEYIKGDYTEIRTDYKGEEVVDNLKADSRTFLYIEVLQTAKVYDSWWIGRSPARGNISEYFGEGDMNKRGERLGNEVGILNVFTWTGLVGVFLYFMVFYKASYMAINKSNNIFSKIIGLFVAFRWLYAWVEDVNNFSLNTFFLWIMIGMCFSESFRKMTNQEFRLWVWGIFEKPKPLSRKKRYNPLTYNKAVTTQ